MFAMPATVLLLLLALACWTGALVTEKRAQLKVGVIYPSTITDFGWSFAHNKGRIYLENKFPGIVTSVVRENVAEGTEGPVIEELIKKENCNFIIAPSFGYQDGVFAAAEGNPKVYFLHTAGFKSRSNMGNIFGKIYQARYLSGMIAASKGDKLGYVAAFHNNAQVVRGINSFFLGARRVNPKVQLFVHFTNTWYKPDLEGFAAEALLDDHGVAVIAQHQDTSEPQWAANVRGKFSIGYNTDMGSLVSSSVLTSPIFKWGKMYEFYVAGAIHNTFKGEIHWWGIENDAVDLAPLSADVSAESAAEVQSVKDDLRAGNDRIFCGEAVASLNPQGEDGCMTPEQLLSNMALLPAIVNLGPIAIPVSEVTTQRSVIIFLAVLVGVGVVTNAVLAVLVFALRNQKQIRSSSPAFMHGMLAGGVLMYAAVIMWLPVPDDPFCIVPIWLLCYGFSLLFGNLLAKTWRIFYIFRQLKKLRYTSITDMQLLPVVGASLVVDTILLVLFTAIDTPAAEKEDFNDDNQLDEYEYRWECDYNGAAVVLFFVIVGWKGLQVAAGCVLSILTRNVQHDFNESKHITFAIYVVAFTSVVVFPIIFLVDNYDSVLIVQALGVIVSTFCAIGILFFPKILNVIFHVEDASTSIGMSRNSMSST